MEFLEIRLRCADVAGQRPFYAGILGLPVWDEAGDWLVVQAGATRLVFEPTGIGAPAYHFAFNIPPNQFTEAKAWVMARLSLLARGDQDEFHFEAWNAHAFYFADPAGNVLEFIARHNLAEESDAPFGPDSIQRVSEIGLPVPRVGLLVDALEATGVPLWQGDREHFAAVGDEHGLAIVVPILRRWLPDERVPALPWPAQIVVRGTRRASHVWPFAPYRIEQVPGPGFIIS